MNRNQKKRVADVLQAIGLGAYAVAFFKAETGPVARTIFGAIGTACIVAAIVLTDADA